MNKYVIELRPDCKMVQQICESDGKIILGTRSINFLEELNCDYINEHYGQLQDDAYQRGLEEGKKQAKAQAHLDVCHDIERVAHGNYQKGLNDAWSAAKKLAMMDTETSQEVTGYFGLFRIMENLTPEEAIEKLKAYEKKQPDKIEVGDEVNWLGDCFIVTRIFQPHNMKEQCDGIDDDGCVYHDVLMDDLEKTGRHFDIQKILEDMRK